MIYIKNFDIKDILSDDDIKNQLYIVLFTQQYHFQ